MKNWSMGSKLGQASACMHACAQTHTHTHTQTACWYCKSVFPLQAWMFAKNTAHICG